MGPSRIELAPQNPRGLVTHADTARNHDVVVDEGEPLAIQTETLPNLSFQAVSLNAVHPGLDGDAQPGT